MKDFCALFWLCVAQGQSRDEGAHEGGDGEEQPNRKSKRRRHLAIVLPASHLLRDNLSRLHAET
jgi:hypothetical protein